MSSKKISDILSSQEIEKFAACFLNTKDPLQNVSFLLDTTAASMFASPTDRSVYYRLTGRPPALKPAQRRRSRLSRHTSRVLSRSSTSKDSVKVALEDQARRLAAVSARQPPRIPTVVTEVMTTTRLRQRSRLQRRARVPKAAGVSQRQSLLPSPSLRRQLQRKSVSLLMFTSRACDIDYRCRG